MPLKKCHNIDRVLRLPGTINYPDAKKRSDGRVATMATLAFSDNGETIYGLAELTRAFPPSKAPKKAPEEFKGDFKPLTADDLGLSQLSPLRSVIDHPAGRDRSGDGVRAACDLLRAGFTKEQVLGVLLNPANKVSAHYLEQKDPRRAALRVLQWIEEHKSDDAPPMDKEPSPITQRRLVTSAEFVEAFVPPDYAIDGLIQRRFLYSMTANTGHGKTAVALLLTLLTALGRSLGSREIDKGRVLYFAGENADDIRMRWIALCEKHGVDPRGLDVHFLPGTGKLSEIAPLIRAEVAEIGEVSLVTIDTSIAYFDGDNENDNVQAVAHARRMRELLELPGGPCVITLCHPVKNAQKDNLVPRGGGAFLNEMDGNLTCWRDEDLVTLHWVGKFRGPDFEPLKFQLRPVKTEKIKDSKGRIVPTVIVQHLDAENESRLEKQMSDNEDALLMAMAKHPGASLAGLAVALSWLTSKGEDKSKVRRHAKKLTTEKLVKTVRGKLVLTEAGVKEATRLATR
jgi:hypothetical protein